MAQEQRNEEASKQQPVESAGVEALIGRLRDQGIAKGRSDADALVTTAQQQAADIIAAAKREADTIQANAREEAGESETTRSGQGHTRRPGIPSAINSRGGRQITWRGRW